jgi:hypothetical protein
MQLAAEVHTAHYSASTHSIVDMLHSHMQSMGLEVYTSYAGLMNRGATHTNNSISCTNIHAIQRSPTGDGKEALVLVTPVALTRGEAMQG